MALPEAQNAQIKSTLNLNPKTNTTLTIGSLIALLVFVAGGAWKIGKYESRLERVESRITNYPDDQRTLTALGTKVDAVVDSNRRIEQKVNDNGERLASVESTVKLLGVGP